MNEAAEAEVEEQEEEECPKCPPVGAPAWMATFADMATLLMAFFVLILSFAEFNVPKFKQISGSLKNAFGVQRVVPIVEQPKGTTVLSLNFSPSPAPAVTKDMTQQTTDITKPDLEVKAKENDQESGEAKAAEDVVKALEDASGGAHPAEDVVEALVEAEKNIQRPVDRMRQHSAIRVRYTACQAGGPAGARLAVQREAATTKPL